MVSTLVPNMRLLGILSEARGEDWGRLCAQIDGLLEETGHDLAEEAVYLFYSASPSHILDQQGECFVARSVVGPKKEVPAPFRLRDWTASSLQKIELNGENLEEMLVELERHAGAEKLQEGFTLVIARHLVKELTVSVHGLF